MVSISVPAFWTGLGRQLVEMGFHGKVVIITDSIVEDLYGAVVEGSLKSSGFEVITLVVPPGEQQKSLETAAVFVQ